MRQSKSAEGEGDSIIAHALTLIGVVLDSAATGHMSSPSAEGQSQELFTSDVEHNTGVLPTLPRLGACRNLKH